MLFSFIQCNEVFMECLLFVGIVLGGEVWKPRSLPQGGRSVHANSCSVGLQKTQGVRGQGQGAVELESGPF